MNVCLFPTDKKVNVRFFMTKTKTYSLLTCNYCFDTLMSHFHFQEEATIKTTLFGYTVHYFKKSIPDTTLS